MESWELGYTQNDEYTKLINCLGTYRSGASWGVEMHSLREGSNIIQIGLLVEISKSKIGVSRNWLLPGGGGNLSEVGLTNRVGE